MRIFLTLLLVGVGCSSPAMALDFATDVDFINLSMWDHLSTKTGQLFEDVYEDIDLTVRASGDFQLPSYVKHKSMLISSNEVVGAQTFEFMFSAPVPLVVQHQTTDDVEIVAVQAGAIMHYTHQYGSPGLVTPIENGFQVQGTGRRITPEGAATGYFETGDIDAVTLTHTSLKPFKFEAFRIGVIKANAPEPGCMSLALICLLGVIARVRRG